MMGNEPPASNVTSNGLKVPEVQSRSQQKTFKNPNDCPDPISPESVHAFLMLENELNKSENYVIEQLIDNSYQELNLLKILKKDIELRYKILRSERIRSPTTTVTQNKNDKTRQIVTLVRTKQFEELNTIINNDLAVLIDQFIQNQENSIKKYANTLEQQKNILEGYKEWQSSYTKKIFEQQSQTDDKLIQLENVYQYYYQVKLKWDNSLKFTKLAKNQLCTAEAFLEQQLINNNNMKELDKLLSIIECRTDLLLASLNMSNVMEYIQNEFHLILPYWCENDVEIIDQLFKHIIEDSQDKQSFKTIRDIITHLRQRVDVQQQWIQAVIDQCISKEYKRMQDIFVKKKYEYWMDKLELSKKILKDKTGKTYDIHIDFDNKFPRPKISLSVELPSVSYFQYN
ncbi:unnamed protein product [Didymodactylos carnosus]|uniref:Uncharacterized protein n=1 Tax=Didymodactylos carnosus TaxID=1234261 RepID=A0A8S2H0R4_9BILA|nr:unnamed protein product [Didymodactylos carnosus]CAF3582766.1 unnamed protein product [Didymodactylos carnosus]